jgi:hypothetical protein
LFFADQAGDFDDIDRRGAAGEDVLGDLGIDPGLPFAAAPVAGKVIGRDEGDKQSRAGQCRVNPQPPIIEPADLVPIKKPRQSPPAAKPPMLDEQSLDKLRHPPADIVGPRVGDKEIKLVRFTRHLARRIQ